MIKPDLDLTRPLVMTTLKSISGHVLPAGSALTVCDDPSAYGEIDRDMAERLYASGAAAYHDEHRPTPVETPEQEKTRLAGEALRDDGLGVPVDLTVWQEDDAETGKAKGQRVTNADLAVIAAREGAVVETDDNKADLTRKIIERRAAGLSAFPTNAESDNSPDADLDGETGAVAPDTPEGADAGLGGDDS